MQLHYISTLEDSAEAQSRFFLRSKTFRRNRLGFSVCSPLGFLLLVFLFSENANTLEEWIGLNLAAIAMGIVCYFAYKSLVSRRIYDYVKREYSELFPSEVVYTLDDQHVKCTGRNYDISFALAELNNVDQDEQYLEISFGNRGLCLIPQRAFPTEEVKQQLLAAIGSP